MRIAELILLCYFVVGGWTAGCKCGQRPEPSKKKIVGGKVAQEHFHPWIGALVYNNPSKTQFCGSTLINDNYVLTAAHCVDRINQGFTVYLGSNAINGSDVQAYELASILIHPRYNRETLDNDAALIKLRSKVKLSRFVRPICLPKNVGYGGRSTFVAGWGTRSKSGKSVNFLRAVQLKVQENSECNQTYSKSGVKITGNMICAFAPNRDSCSGDSGGPLALKDGPVIRQIGIVSFGIDCGDPRYPGVYTRVTKYLKFISDNTKDAQYCS